jgi:L-fuculose-phosphate aldolase
MSTRLEEQLRAEIVEVGRRMYARGYVASNDGNISARLDDSRLITTPTAVSKGYMTPDMMVVVDYEGRQLSGERKASSELKMHLEIYRNRPDVNGVVHAHPPLATGFAVAGIPLTRAVLAEVITTLGSVPIAEYATPSTAELPEAVRKYIKAHDGMLLANHGAVTCGVGVTAAYHKMETIEHFAKISLVARLLGRENLISRGEVERLQGLRGTYGIAAPAPLCTFPSPADPGNQIGNPIGDQILCQVLEAPESQERLVPDLLRGPYESTAYQLQLASKHEHAAATTERPATEPQSLSSSTLRQASRDGEIRLTYGELTALIADAIKNLKD